jgi:hypothetical protein
MTPLALIAFLVILLFIFLIAYLIRQDARKRGIAESAALVFTLLTIFVFPVGLLVYIAYVLGRSSRNI